MFGLVSTNFAVFLLKSVFLFARDTDSRFSSDTDFSEDLDGRGPNTTKGKV